MRYTISVERKANRLADLGSRWGNRFAQKKMEGLRGGPRPLMKKVLRTSKPAVDGKVRDPDLDIGRWGLLPLNANTVCREDIALVQEKYYKSRPDGLKRSRESPTLWVNDARRIWVPAAATKLKRILYALAHQGLAGHRGRGATIRNLTRQFTWDNLEEEVKQWRNQCLQCIKLYNGDTIPRPLGSQLLAERPGEIVSIDYIKLGATKTGYNYALILVDPMTRSVMFVPAGTTTAILAARSLIRWGSRHGLPKWLISDGAGHFKNDVIKELTQMLGIKHHITLAYCPWANGSVEIVGRDLLWTLRAVTSEFRTGLDEWDLVLPLVEFTINHRERGVLGNRSAIEAMTGQKPTSTTKLAVWSGVKMKNARGLVTTWARVEQHCARLEISLQRLHEKVKDQEEARMRRKALRAAKRPPGQNFNTGDYVMVTSANNQSNPFRTHKVMVHWQGPYEVLGGAGPTEYEVRLLGDTDKSTVHWKKMRRLAGPELDPSEEVIAIALHDRHKFVVEKFEDWIVDDGDAKLFVRWKNHGDEERTWEPLEQLTQDVPEKVAKYVEQVGDVDLRCAYDQCVAANQALSNLRNRSRAADNTNDTHAAVGRRADRAAQRSTKPATQPHPMTTQDANAARDRRAAARRKKVEKS